MKSDNNKYVITYRTRLSDDFEHRETFFAQTEQRALEKFRAFCRKYEINIVDMRVEV